ncbi:MAG TPA: sialidase family protein, partial [Thermoplasmata archaeon]|nr:sialidase family protein [Thermoplasmata archaeon]
MEGKRLAIGSTAVVVGLVVLSMSNAVAARIVFSTPLVIGWTAGNDWEPDVAADGSGNAYVAWGHFGGVPGCTTCSSPAAMIQISHDGGKTWGAPKPLNPT